MPIEVKIPAVGESITEVFIGSWLKQEGDSVAADEALVELETDKATLEIPAPVAGKLVGVKLATGDSANVGDVIAFIDEGAAPAASDSAGTGPGATPAEAPAQADAPAQAEAPAQAASDGEKFVMPAAAKLAAEQGVDTSGVKASGPGGRVLKEDVQAALTAAPAAEPVASGAREEEVVPMTPLRRRIAERLVESQQTAAILTTFNEADMSAVMALRKEFRDSFEKKHDVRLGFMSFFVRAAIDALRQIPQLNAEVRDESIVYRNYFDIGVAVSTPKGLVVPVVRNAERLSFAELEKTIGDFGQRASRNRLTPDELTGGTFTISNGGVFGSLLSTPIINPPQSGVLGMHTIKERPVAINGKVEIRPMMYLALSYDHRIIDGREAVTFLKRIVDTIENPTRLLLEV